jgi:hypothetical protein
VRFGAGVVAAVALVGGCSSTSGTPGAREALGDAPSATPSLVKEAGFKTPSGNIGCYLTTGQVRCDIAEKSWKPPPKPADCDLDYGLGVTLDATVLFVCAGDTVLGAPATLPYGSSMQAGDVRCDSAEAALRCENMATKHGFTLSRERYELW